MSESRCPGNRMSPLGARAVQIADGGTSTYFLTTFGRSPREPSLEGR
jgi:hypothetical protein